jgi:ubiquinone/menaquinone biosynthesis C-methylase UbiE
MHLDEKDEHFFALSFMVGVIDYLGIQSILDIGSGTGRAIQYLKIVRPELRLVGVEPVKELREIGYSKGLSGDELIDGDATNLKFATGEFDLVCEFGVLHHIRNPALAIAEMLRVSNRAVFISDSNNFGQGSISSRLIKQVINLLGLWKFVDLIKTRGKGYTISEGDGLAYSYSVFRTSIFSIQKTDSLTPTKQQVMLHCLVLRSKSPNKTLHQTILLLRCKVALVCKDEMY